MVEDSNSCGQYLNPGTRVCYESTDGGGTLSRELGVVIHCWMNDEIDMYDCMVAFFGDEFPTKYPKEPPYVLRYASVSLIVLDAE